MKKVKLPSGSELTIDKATFSVSKALFQAMTEDFKQVKMGECSQMNLTKDLFCQFLSSPKIEACLHKCMERCLYNGKRIASVDETFESEAARQDYISVCFEVTQENLMDFMKDLSAVFEQAWAKFGKIPS